MAAKRTPTVKKIIYTSPFFAIGPTDGYVADETVVEVMLMGGTIFEHLGDRAWQASRVAELEAEIHMSNDKTCKSYESRGVFSQNPNKEPIIPKDISTQSSFSLNLRSEDPFGMNFYWSSSTFMG
ncbi:hypothetical protein U9M48_028762 [Paspalum notatum var. saurae]|uniref:Uncharacterized protein n=1 Tax=Paspalum notatum var. saurae TaxID=547442 RepID=A0AAQ3U1W3_PASNO